MFPPVNYDSWTDIMYVYFIRRLECWYEACQSSLQSGTVFPHSKDCLHLHRIEGCVISSPIFLLLFQTLIRLYWLHLSWMHSPYHVLAHIQDSRHQISFDSIKKNVANMFLFPSYHPNLIRWLTSFFLSYHSRLDCVNYSIGRNGFHLFFSLTVLREPQVTTTGKKISRLVRNNWLRHEMVMS